MDVPAGTRAFFQVKTDGTESVGKDPLFALTTKSVCGVCNNGWMNDLDLKVEKWVLRPDPLDPGCSPQELRRWAIKVAIPRSRRDEDDLAFPSDDMTRVHSGQDIEDWHVFIGSTQRPEHRHNFGSFAGGLIEQGSISQGVIQVSWSLGTALVTALRIAGEPGRHFLKAFKSYNRQQSLPFAEVLPSAAAVPPLTTRPQIPNWLITSFFRYFTPDTASPVADAIRQGRDKVSGTLREDNLRGASHWQTGGPFTLTNDSDNTLTNTSELPTNEDTDRRSFTTVCRTKQGIR